MHSSIKRRDRVCNSKSQSAIRANGCWIFNFGWDVVGDFVPIKYKYKTDMWTLLRFRNSVTLQHGHTSPIPNDRLQKSKVLNFVQIRKTQIYWDQWFRSYVYEDHGYEALLADGFNPELVRRVISLVDRAECKAAISSWHQSFTTSLRKGSLPSYDFTLNKQT